MAREHASAVEKNLLMKKPLIKNLASYSESPLEIAHSFATDSESGLSTMDAEDTYC